MSTCVVCNKEIPRGKKFKGERYKTLAFCSEMCYNAYVANKNTSKDDNGLNQLKAYIDELWDGQVNWPFMMRQIKNICSDYNLNYKQLYKVLRYGIVFDNAVVDPQYGLMQFVKYIEPSKQLVAQIKSNRELAESMEEEVVVVRKPTKQRRYVKEEEWD